MLLKLGLEGIDFKIEIEAKLISLHEIESFKKIDKFSCSFSLTFRDGIKGELESNKLVLKE